MKSLLALTYALVSLVSKCESFAIKNPVQDLLSKIPGLPVRSSQNNEKPRGQALLQQLQLKASTEPKWASASLEQIPNLLLASVAAVVRAGTGVFAQDYRLRIVPRSNNTYTYISFKDWQLEETGVFKQPLEPLILYEFEACPFCRKVREACSMLSLPITFRPTPRNGPRFRNEIKARFGPKATFPYLVDPNTGVSMFESNDIIQYLFKVYGNGQVPNTLQDSPLVTLTAGVGVGLARLGAGGFYQPSNPPAQPLILWAYEGSPFCKVVREKLSQMELAHTVMYTPRGSGNRQVLWENQKRFQVPFLQDPNTDVELFESEAINEYLEKQYGVPKSPVAYL